MSGDNQLDKASPCSESTRFKQVQRLSDGLSWGWWGGSRCLSCRGSWCSLGCAWGWCAWLWPVLTRAGETWRRVTVATSLTGAHANDAMVNGRLDGVVHLDVSLWGSVVIVHGALADITLACGLDDIPDNEPLDGLVLWDELARHGAEHALDVATALLVPTVVTTFLCPESRGER